MENNQENNQKKGSTAVLPIIMVLLVLLAGVGGWYLGNTWLKTDESKEEIENEEEENEVVKYLETDSALVRNLVSNYPSNYIEGIVVADMSNESKQWAVLGYLNSPTIITEEQFQDTNRLLFGPDSVLENKDILASENDALYEYNQETQYYTRQDISGYGSPISASELIRNIVEAKVEGDQLVVTVRIGYKYINEEGNFAYRDTEGNEFTELNDVLDNEQLTKFEHRYSYDEENMNYYLTEVVKVN